MDDYANSGTRRFEAPVIIALFMVVGILLIAPSCREALAGDDSLSLDLGRIESGAKSKATFELRNDSQVPWENPKAAVSCSCVSATLLKAECPPGGVLPIEVEFDSTGRYGPQAQTVRVTTAPGAAAITFTVRADIGSYAIVSTRRLHLRMAAGEDSAEGEVFVTDDMQACPPLPTATCHGVHAEFLRADYQVVSVEGRRRSGKLAIRAARPPEGVDAYSALIKINWKSALGVREQRVLVTVALENEFQLTPKLLLVEPGVAILKAKVRDDLDVGELKIEVPPGVEIAGEQVAQPYRTWWLKVPDSELMDPIRVASERWSETVPIVFLK